MVDGAGPLFEEPGTLERVAELTIAWFRRYLTPEGCAASAQGVT